MKRLTVLAIAALAAGLIFKEKEVKCDEKATDFGYCALGVAD